MEMIPLPRDPKDLMAVTQCRHCYEVQGAFHLVEDGTLALGRVLCQSCGRVDKPASLRPLRRMVPTIDPDPRVNILLDDETHEWPERPATGEEQFG